MSDTAAAGGSANANGDTVGQGPANTDNGNATNNTTDWFDSLPEPAQKELRKARDDAAKYRQRAGKAADDAWFQKANEAVEQLEAMELASQSETQKLTSARDKAEQAAQSAQRELWGLRAALNAGIPPEKAADIAKRLSGDSEDDYAADAKQLKELLFGADKREDPTQGKSGGSGGSPADLFAEFLNKR